MIHVTTSEAQQRLPDLLAHVEGGNAVEIRAENGRTFQLVANPPRPKGVPKAGRYQGLIKMAPDFDAPMELRECEE